MAEGEIKEQGEGAERGGGRDERQREPVLTDPS